MKRKGCKQLDVIGHTEARREGCARVVGPEKLALLRRALTPLSRRIATRMDVVFEEVGCHALGPPRL